MDDKRKNIYMAAWTIGVVVLAVMILVVIEYAKEVKEECYCNYGFEIEPGLFKQTNLTIPRIFNVTSSTSESQPGGTQT